MIEMQLTMVQTPIVPDGKTSFGTDMDAILGVIWKDPNEPLKEFTGIFLHKNTWNTYTCNHSNLHNFIYWWLHR